MSIANSIWYDETRVTVFESFLNANRELFGAEVIGADFDDADAVGAINDWVYEMTDGMIDGIIDAISPLVVMYLINAIAFDAEWNQPFVDDLVPAVDLQAGQVVVRAIPGLLEDEL
jgi:serpin B